MVTHRIGGKVMFKQISYEEYNTYLRKHNHFLDEFSYHKPYTNWLNNYQSTIENPLYGFYGIVENNNIVGVTGIQEFEHQLLPSNSIRYRVLRIDEELRGNNVGITLLDFAAQHWPEKKYLFGYARDIHTAWSVKQAFDNINGMVGDHNHNFMGKSIAQPSRAG